MLESTGCCHAWVQPHLLHFSLSRGTAGDTIAHKATVGWLGDSLGGSWVSQGSCRTSGRGTEAGMQTNSKVQPVPGVMAVLIAWRSLHHGCCPVPLTINKGALQGQPHGPCTLLPSTLRCSLGHA